MVGGSGWSRVVEALVGVILVFGAVTSTVGGAGDWHDVAARLAKFVSASDPGLTASLLFGAAAGVEVALGLRLIAGATRGERWGAVATILALTGALIAKGATLGWAVPCGCLEGILSQSVAGAVVRNAVLLGAFGLARGMRARTPAIAGPA